MRRRAFLEAFLGVAGAALVARARAHAGHAPPAPGYSRSIARYAVPDAALVDTQGRPFDIRSALDGGPVMLNFIFTSCAAICPVMSATFAKAQEQLARAGEDAQLVSVSIDPDFDTPARLRDYARRLGAGPRWRFVTGTRAASLALQRAFDVYRGGKMSHDPVTFLRRGGRRPWVRIDGFASARELVEELRRADER